MRAKVASGDRVAAWERRTEVPLLLLAAAFLVAYAWPVLDPSLDGGVESSLRVVSWTVWAAFAVDFVVRLSLADDRVSYALRHCWDVALIALPMLRPLRLLRLLAFAQLLHRSARVTLAGRVGIYVSGTAVAAVGLGAIAVLDAERGAPDATITTFGDALWWSVTTVSTVGYGDVYPVTTAGRLVATALMIVGIAVVGTVTASVAAWLVNEVAADAADEESEAGPGSAG
jgi:voltage-gated potassium channel